MLLLSLGRRTREERRRIQRRYFQRPTIKLLAAYRRESRRSHAESRPAKNPPPLERRIWEEKREREREKEKNGENWRGKKKKSIRVPYGFRNWTTIRAKSCLDWKPNFAGLNGIVNSRVWNEIEMRINLWRSIYEIADVSSFRDFLKRVAWNIDFSRWKS